jgi:trimethylamine monooxygenase
MDTLIGSDGKNAVKGKRILLIGDSYSAEDLALQCIKLGAENIYFTSRELQGSASYMGSWPDGKVEMLIFAEVSGVKDDGTGKTIVFETGDESHHVPDVEDVSIVIF